MVGAGAQLRSGLTLKVTAISAALFEADPVGINFETNTEYESEAETIVMVALPSAEGPKDVQALIYEAFVQWFDVETAGFLERYDSVADDIWCLWNRHRGRAG